MKVERWSATVLMLFLCGGCFQIKDELTLQADGSGTVQIETRSSIPSKTARALAEMLVASGAEAMYPPVGESDAKRLFPGKDFAVTVHQEDTEDRGFVSVVTATFKDINALLASPYGQAHALTVNLRKGVMSVTAVTGAEALAHLTEMEAGPFGMPAAEAADVEKKKAQMRAEFVVTLPHAVTTANGTREGKTAGWVFARAKCKDAAEFAQRLGSVLEAACSADGLAIHPATPLRLGLLPFTELTDGARGKNAPGEVDAQAIMAAVRFVPHLLEVTRSRDLSGYKPFLPSNWGAELSGEVVVPRKLAPQRWGEARVDEVVDSGGNSLLPAGGRESYQIKPSRGGVEEQEQQGRIGAEIMEERRWVRLNFKAPEWNIKEIARLKASIPFQFLGGSEVVKLPQAIPATWITEAKDPKLDEKDPEEPLLRHPRLRKLGWVVHFEGGTAQNGMTQLMLQVDGAKAVLSQAQVFDSKGRPWPTFLHRDDMDDGVRCTLTVPGRPQAPLSLAFLATGVGTTVNVPILLEHLPLTER